MLHENPMANQPRDNWILSPQALKPELCDVIVKEYLKKKLLIQKKYLSKRL